MTTRKIYNHLTGQVVETTATNAWDVVENHQTPGWSYNPAPAETETETTDGQGEEVPEGQEGVEEEVTEDVPAPKPEDLQPASLDDLSLNELRALAEDRGLEFDRRWGTARMLALLQD